MLLHDERFLIERFLTTPLFLSPSTPNKLVELSRPRMANYCLHSLTCMGACLCICSVSFSLFLLFVITHTLFFLLVVD
jgi:hypothetical protein